MDTGNVEAVNRESDVDGKPGKGSRRRARQLFQYNEGPTLRNEPVTSLACPIFLSLPRVSDSNWMEMSSWRETNRSHSTRSLTKVPAGIQTVWHPDKVDVSSLKELFRGESGVHEVLYNGKLAIAKTARSERESRLIERETGAYLQMESFRSNWSFNIAPVFLAHLTENGRVIGMLLEMLEGDFPTKDDLPACEDALHKLHQMNIIHGDVDRYIFIIDRSTDVVRVIDFQYARPDERTEAWTEIESLRTKHFHDELEESLHTYVHNEQ